MAESPEDLPALSQTQLEIMEVIWMRGRATVGTVWSEIVTRRSVARNTVLTLMERLERKGWLVRHDDGPVQEYSAARPRKQTLSRMARQFVDAMFDGSPEDFLLALLDDRQLSAEESKRIRQLIDNARRRDR
jgi:BlaI family transcriptional regulator, penicillinase repressor